MTATKPQDKSDKPLERQSIYWFYGSASLAYGIKNNAFSYLLLIYSNKVLGVPGYLASLALALAMVWDAVSDLLLGHWSDKNQPSPWSSPPLHVCSLPDPAPGLLCTVQSAG